MPLPGWSDIGALHVDPLRDGILSPGEMLFIMVLFHANSYRTFKHLRGYGVSQEFRSCFGIMPGYERFVEPMPGWPCSFIGCCTV